MTTILIVDDNRDVAKASNRYLSSFGLDCFEVYSAEEALEFLKTNEVNLVITDNDMAGMSGKELYLQLESRLPVIIYTANPEVLGVGCPVVTKPNATLLSQCVLGVLGHHGRERD